MDVRIKLGPRTAKFRNTFDPDTYELIGDEGIGSRVVLRSAPEGSPVLVVSRYKDQRVTSESSINDISFVCEVLSNIDLTEWIERANQIIGSSLINVNHITGIRMVTNNEIEIFVIPIHDDWAIIIAHPRSEDESLEAQVRNFIGSMKVTEAPPNR